MSQSSIGEILRKCMLDGRHEHWEQFIGLAQPLIAAAVWRAIARYTVPSRDAVDDLVQETFLRLCDNNCHALRSFRAGDETALKTYLRTIAASVTVDHVRARSSAKRGSGRAAAALEDVEPMLGADDAHVAELERRQLLDGVERCLEKQDPRNRRVFWLYHAQGLTPRLIAALPGIGLAAGGIETLVYRMTRLVRECLHRSRMLPAAKIPEGGRA